MSDFDPADPPDSYGIDQGNAITMYETLLDRGDEETAEELRSKDTPSQMGRFIRQQVVSFDPKHDDDAYNAARAKIQNVYEALVEIGREDLAEELRDHINVTSQSRHATKLVKQVEAEIHPQTGEIEGMPDDEAAADAGTAAAASPDSVEGV